MLKTCLKCGHSNHTASGAELEPCPSCGAIYSRVESAWGVAATPSGARRISPPPGAEAELPPQWKTGSHGAPADDSVERFAGRLRGATLYPTFRALVGVLYWLTVFFAVLSVAVGAIAAWRLGGASGLGVFLAGLFVGVFWLVVAKVSREMSWMLADLSDAAVRIASRMRP